MEQEKIFEYLEKRFATQTEWFDSEAERLNNNLTNHRENIIKDLKENREFIIGHVKEMLDKLRPEGNLRDHFAMAAMDGCIQLLLKEATIDGEKIKSLRDVVKTAYICADLALTERDKESS